MATTDSHSNNHHHHHRPFSPEDTSRYSSPTSSTLFLPKNGPEPRSFPALPRRKKLLFLGVVAFVLAFTLFVASLDYTSFSQLRGDSFPLPGDGKVLKNTTAVVDDAPNRIHGHGIATATVTAVVTQTKTVTVYKPVDAEPIHFALISFSEDSASEGAILIKSILMYNSRPSHIHVICDEAAQRYLEKRLLLVRRPSRDVRVYFYRLTSQMMRDRVAREGTITTDHSAGYAGLMKLFVHELLPTSVHQAIFVDTDAFFIYDPAHLHSLFSTLFTSETALAMPSHPDQDTPEWNYASQICSCVMLMDLRKLRSITFIDSKLYHTQPSPSSPKIQDSISPSAFREMYGNPDPKTGHFENVRLGDQGYFWAIVKQHPEIVKPLDYEWEVSSCLMDMYMTGLAENVDGDDDAVDEETELSRQVHVKDTPQEGKAILPKILHFNCLHGTPRYYNWKGWSDPENFLNKRWGATVSHHARYKWTWLNSRPQNFGHGAKVDSTGKDLPTMEIVTVKDVRFADERYAAGENVL